MKVYIAELSIPYEGAIHIGVYTTLAKAKKACQAYNARSNDSQDIKWTFRDKSSYLWGTFEASYGGEAYNSMLIRICEVE